jgi:hypothetical protein
MDHGMFGVISPFLIIAACVFMFMLGQAHRDGR